MYIRKTNRIYKGKRYTNHLLVESVHTPKGPRQRVICSLGSLAPAPQEDWLALAHKLDSALRGQLSLQAPEASIDPLLEKARKGHKQKRKAVPPAAADSIVAVDTDRVEIEEPVAGRARACGPSDMAAVGTG